MQARGFFKLTIETHVSPLKSVSGPHPCVGALAGGRQPAGRAANALKAALGARGPGGGARPAPGEVLHGQCALGSALFPGSPRLL